MKVNPKNATTEKAAIDNTELVTQFRQMGGHIFHIRPHQNISGKWSRGMTVAYMKKSGHVVLATAVQHRNDVFTKKLGTQTAIKHYLEGSTITLPVFLNDSFFANLKYSMELLCY